MRKSTTTGPGARGEVTRLLGALDQGDEPARDRVYELLYVELRKIAGALLRARRRGSLQTGDVIGEACVRLLDQSVTPKNSGHFLRIAALAMRRVLADYAKARSRAKRGGAWSRVELQLDWPDAGRGPIDIVAAEEIVTALEAADEEVGAIVTMRFFGGLSEAETAQALAMKPEKVRKLWEGAKRLMSARLAKERS
jgi:RNA polymerase sigma factor (TIGR02999 family)